MFLLDCCWLHLIQVCQEFLHIPQAKWFHFNMKSEIPKQPLFQATLGKYWRVWAAMSPFPLFPLVPRLCLSPGLPGQHSSCQLGFFFFFYAAPNTLLGDSKLEVLYSVLSFSPECCMTATSAIFPSFTDPGADVQGVKWLRQSLSALGSDSSSQPGISALRCYLPWPLLHVTTMSCYFHSKS